MFPYDTITLFQEVVGNTNFTLVNGNDEKTIVGISLIQSKDLSDTVILCGTDVISKNYAKDLPFNILNYQCADDIIISKTGNDESSVILSYVPYFTSELSTSTQYGYNPTASIASTSDVKIYGSMSAGEVLIAFLLVLLFLVGLIDMMVRSLYGIKTKKKYISYDKADVPVNEEL